MAKLQSGMRTVCFVSMLFFFKGINSTTLQELPVQIQEMIHKHHNDFTTVGSPVDYREEVWNTSARSSKDGPVASTQEEKEIAEAHQETATKKYKGGWMNKMVLLLASYNMRRWNVVHELVLKFSQHEKVWFQIKCLESAIQKWADKAGPMLGYDY